MFEYTEHRSVNSSALTDLYYNERSRELAVVTKNGHAYVYPNVPQGVFHHLAQHRTSVGNYYATVIKKYYGPGTHLGHVPSVVFVKAGEKVSAGTPKGLTYAEDAVVDGKPVNEANYITLGQATNENSVMANTTNSGYFGFGAGRRHTVVFTVDGGSDRKETTVTALNVEQAVKQVTDLTGSLDLSIKVVEVTTHFE